MGSNREGLRAYINVGGLLAGGERDGLKVAIWVWCW